MSEFRVSWWDRFLVGVAPGWGLQRLRSRAAAHMMARHYDAASIGRRTDGWRRSSSDANAAATPHLSRLRDLSRDLVRNNGWAGKAVEVIAHNVVGPGIVAQPVAGPLQRAASEVWARWGETEACDWDQALPWSGLQELAMRTLVESGEVLIVREVAGPNDALPSSAPIRIRVLEGDYLDHSRTGLVGSAGGPVLHGIEHDARGRRVAYYLYDHHPGAGYAYRSTYGVRRYPADQVIHCYRVDRPGQKRGVPWLAAAIAKLQDFDDYEDAVLMQQKIAACFAAFVTDSDGTTAALGAQSDSDPHLESLEPGMIEYLPAGKDVRFVTPPSSSGHPQFSATNLRRIAASVGVTYEDMTGDYSQVNYSSARMARLAHWQSVHTWRWNMFIPKVCAGVWRWVMGEAARMEGWPEVPRAQWTAPPMPMLDPDKEGAAYQRLVRSGTMSLFEAIRERGEDPIAVLDEIAAANAELDARGIVLDSDPRKTSTSGGIQGGGGQQNEQA